MAMISCPHCGEPISDKAEYCPHCKERVIAEETIICPECGAEIPKSSATCPKCGVPISNDKEIQKVEVAGFTKPQISKNFKKYILIGLAAVAVIVGIFFAVSSNSEKEWQKNYNSAVTAMLNGAAKAETTASLIHSVWSNSIYKKADPKTNKYTLTEYYRSDSSYTSRTSLSDYYFNDDFNTSLGVLFSSTEYTTAASTIKTSQERVAGLMAQISKKVPKGKENAYAAISALYDQYLGLTNLAIDPSGNLNSYTSNFNKYDNDFLAAFNKAKTFTGE